MPTINVARLVSLPEVVQITINRPESQNALTYEMMVSLAKAFKDLRTSSSPPKAVIITGAGEKAFTSGVDLTAAMKVFKVDEADLEKDVVAQPGFFAMDLCTFPIVGAINGWAINAGFEIALACDVLVASSNALFLDTHCQFGLMPSWGLSQRLPRLVGPNRAREVSLFGTPVNATTALVWGIVNRVVPLESMMQTAEEMVAQMINRDATIVASYKRTLNDGLALPLGEARAMERSRGFARYRAMTAEDFDVMKRFIKERKLDRPAIPKAKL